jgi:hypothetical protein
MVNYATKIAYMSTLAVPVQTMVLSGSENVE